jgi:hypothetical protein
MPIKTSDASPRILKGHELTEAQFLKDIAKHTLTVIREDGLYRHLRLQQPGNTDMYFDIITWPGYLCYCGDMGSYVFARVPDMLTFFRGRSPDGPLEINPHYWSEKVEARDRDGITQYSAERFKQNVLDYLDDAEASDEVREAVQESILDFADEEHYAMRAVHDFDECNFRFIDFWEKDPTVYTVRYLWCCYALTWAIRLYDNATTSKAAA